MLAGVALPNEASEGLHRALGLDPAGTYRRVGWKLGRWHDVAWYQKDLVGDWSPGVDVVGVAQAGGQVLALQRGHVADRGEAAISVGDREAGALLPVLRRGGPAVVQGPGARAVEHDGGEADPTGVPVPVAADQGGARHCHSTPSRPLIAALHAGRAPRPTLPVDVRRAVLAPLLPDIALLEELTGESLADWTADTGHGDFRSRQAPAAGGSPS